MIGSRRARFFGALVIVATFVVGALVGAVTDRALSADPAPAAAPATDSTRERRGDDDRRDGRRGESKLLERLDLSAEQDAEVDVIIERSKQRMEAVWDTVGPRFHAIMDSTRAEIRAVLDPAQRVEYDRLLEERQREKEKREAEKQSRRERGEVDDHAALDHLYPDWRAGV